MIRGHRLYIPFAPALSPKGIRDYMNLPSLDGRGKGEGDEVNSFTLASSGKRISLLRINHFHRSRTTTY
jgi:hypothetical protein